MKNNLEKYKESNIELETEIVDLNKQIDEQYHHMKWMKLALWGWRNYTIYWFWKTKMNKIMVKRMSE